MQDVISVAVLVVFFGLGALFVKACDSIIGPDEAVLGRQAGDPTPEPEGLAA